MPASASPSATKLVHESAALSPDDATSLGASCSRAFTVLARRPELDTTLPTMHHELQRDDGDGNSSGSSQSDEDEEEEEDDDDSSGSRLTTIRRGLSKSSEQLPSLPGPLASVARPLFRSRGCSKSQGSLRPGGATADEFGVALRLRLARLQQQQQQRKRDQEHARHPKPFVSTVRKGEFLMPPAEVAVLLGIGPPPAMRARPEHDFDEVQPSVQPRRRAEARPEVRHRMHHARCQEALRGPADLAFGSPVPRQTDCQTSGFSLGGSSGGSHCRSRDSSLQLPRQTDQPPPFGNLMFDRRIVRGSTFATPPVLMCNEQSQAARQAEARRRQVMRKRAQLQSVRATLVRIGTPPPVPGRKHEPVQTELFLEELFEKPDEIEVAVQTDYFLDRPATPPYCPPKTGQDASTQIQPGDLFDYDVEVQPILEVLVGKTIEQAFMEVLEEEEIAILREQQRKFLELRAAEKAEQQRLEEQDRRIREEKDRRLREHEEALKVQLETEERVAAAVLLTGYIAELLPQVLESLKISGFLLDEIKADVEEGFMPWLMKEVKREMGTVIESREILEGIIRDIIENRARTYERLGREYDASRKSKAESFGDVCEEGDEMYENTLGRFTDDTDSGSEK